MTSVVAGQAVLSATVLALCPPVQAPSTAKAPPCGLSGCIGVGVGHGPATVVARQSLGERGAMGATWANRDSMQTHFGVTAARAQATSLPVCTPKSGCRKAVADLGAEYLLASSWTLQANLGLTQFGDAAAASPIVGRRNSASAELGVAHAS